jgi:hypothetical protein
LNHFDTPLLEGSSTLFFKEDVMRTISKLLLIALASLFTACPAQEKVVQEKTVTVGKLEVKITGLPLGVIPNVTVTGPNAFKQVISSPGQTSTTIKDLPVGSYTVAAADVSADSNSYAPTVTDSPANVTAGATSSMSVVYTTPSRTITGKLISVSGQPITTNNLNGQTLALRVLGSKVEIPVDANGAFAVNDVPATYSLVVFLNSPYSQSAIVYQGLTRTNPTLTLIPVPSGGTGFPSGYASVAGKIIGGSGFKTGSTDSTLVAVAIPKAVSTNLSIPFFPADPVTGAYTTTASWNGGNPITATLHALQFSTDINGKITAYGGYGKQNVDLVNQSAVPVPDPNPNPGPPAPIKKDVALEAVSTGNLTGAISWPRGMTNPQYAVATILFLDVSNQLYFPLLKPGQNPSSSTASSSLNQLVPLIAGAKFLQTASINELPNGPGASVGSSIWKVMTPGTPADFVVPPGISLDKPATAASGIANGSSFSWSRYTGGIHVFNISPDYSASPSPTTKSISLQIITASSSLKLPDLSAYGLFEFPKTSEYNWNVLGVGPYSSIDAATDTGGLTLPYGPVPPTSDGGFSISPTRTFTTAP